MNKFFRDISTTPANLCYIFWQPSVYFRGRFFMDEHYFDRIEAETMPLIVSSLFLLCYFLSSLFFCSFRFSLFLFIWWNGIVLQRCKLREMELEPGWKTTSSLPDCWHRAARSLFVGLFGFLFSEKCSSYVSWMMLFIAVHRELYTVAISQTFADV